MVFRKLMSMVLVCFLVYDLLFLMLCNEVFAESWYPFDIPMDDALSNAIDVGKIVLDAPAGKHGFLTVKDGHFYFEDGTRTKFWGANLTFKACFPSHENAEKTAAHLAKYGFNIVRIHHIDTLSEPQGIFDSTTGDTKTLSEDQLEKLDYLIFKLKEKGIYVDLNLHVGRNFTGKDGVTSADSLPENSKIVTLYDDKLIELQKDYAKKLLKHYNPYTKKMYSEEPAIALVEITNENSIFPAWTDGALFGQPGEVDYKNPLPGYYVKELDVKWNEWLKNKYGTTENLKKAWSLKDSGISNYINNPGFETEWEDYWRSELHGTSVSFTRDASEKNSGNYSLCANIGTINAEDYGVQFKQLGIKLEKGKNYRLSFYAKADRERAINVSYMQNESPWNGYGLAANFDLKKQWGLYSVEFTVNREVTSDSKVSFILGGSLGKVWIDDIKLEEVKISYVGSDESIEDSTVRRTDWKDRYKVTDKRFADNTEFYYSLEKSFFDDMISYLKKDLGLRVPVSTSNFYFGQPDLMAQLSGDFMNTHAYWDHPIFNGGEDIIENYSQSNGSVIRDVGNTKGKIEFSSFIERIALSTVQGKPLVVSEWNSPYPNEYEYEMASLITAYGLLQGWEGLFVYSYSNNFNETSETKKIDCMFNIINNPVKMSQMPLCSLMFLRNDIKEAEKTIKLRYNRDEAISEYKYNSGSRKLQIVEGYIPASAVLNHKILHGNFDYEEKAYLKHFFTEDQLNELIEEADHISDTNELTLKSSVKNKEYFVVDTSRVQGVNGFISGQSIKTKDIKFSLSTNAAAFLVTLDYKPIPESVKMLFFLSARQKNSGQTKNADLTKITNLGSGPALLEAVTGYVDINVNANASLYEAYSLDGSGERLAKKKVEVISSNTIRIYLDGNSPWLEIIRSSNTSPINNVTPTATPIKTPTTTPIKTPTATPIKTPTTTPIKTPTQTPIKT
ncbi:MAG: hypothetical protein GX660_25805, partial [Clostridiaceae bacterium]|nr:hypothetical protein [Clostridiaceae bacterium]